VTTERLKVGLSGERCKWSDTPACGVGGKDPQ
jgi:hypothetical protein